LHLIGDNLNPGLQDLFEPFGVEITETKEANPFVSLKELQGLDILSVIILSQC
jgi:hypothetical protein